jgi:hypothetical protein
MRTDLKCLFLPAPVATIETVWRNFRSEELAAAAEAGLVRQRKVRRSGIVSVTPAEGWLLPGRGDGEGYAGAGHRALLAG